MSDLLLKTKLSMPVIRKDLVARPRLIEKLNADLWQAHDFAPKLTLVSAPAGFGKTTLVVDWIGKIGSRAVWLSLDENDNDPARFLAYLLAALQQIDAKIGLAAIGMQQSPQPPPGETIITSLINDLAEISQPFILALDDYHIIKNPLIHRQVAFLLERQPVKLMCPFTWISICCILYFLCVGLAAAEDRPTGDEYEPCHCQPAEQVADGGVEGEHTVGGNLGNHDPLAGSQDIGGGQNPAVFSKGYELASVATLLRNDILQAGRWLDEKTRSLSDRGRVLYAFS